MKFISFGCALWLSLGCNSRVQRAVPVTQPSNPPPIEPSSQQAVAPRPSSAERLIALIDNSQIHEWSFARDETGVLTRLPTWPWRFVQAAKRVVAIPADKRDPLHDRCAQLVPLLIRSLDDPQRFVTAHLILHCWWTWEYTDNLTDPPDDDIPIVSFEEQPDRSVLCLADGLSVRLREIDDRYTAGPYHTVNYSCTATIDLAQRPAIRDQWHRREQELIRRIGTIKSD